MSARRSAQPRFVWQGALIVLPALLLAAAGLHSLRQDQLLAEHEATQEARRQAIAINELRLPEQLFPPLPDSTMIVQWLRAPASQSDVPAVSIPNDSFDRFIVLVGADGDLISPPAMTQRPAPQPLDLDALNPSQRTAWEHWVGAAPTGDASTGEALIGELLNARLPDRWVANARFRTAIIARDRGNTSTALHFFQNVIEAHPDATGETGMPLRALAALELARLSSVYPGTLRALCAEIVATPNPSTETLLALAAAVDPSSAHWRKTFQEHERTRRFYEVLRQSAAPAFVFEHARYFALSRQDGAAQWIVGLSAKTLRAVCERAVARQTLPAQFRASISFDDALPTAGTTTPLAHLEGAWPSFRGSIPFRIDVSLSDPKAFSAQQRARTIRLAALIVASTAAVFIGFVSAWRSFRKQQQLSEMKTNFVSSVSHELRAPIASMRLMAEELESGTAPSRTKLREYHHFIGQECRRLSALVENVLDFSRREQGRESFEFAVADLEKAVRETIGIMTPYAHERGVDLRLQVDGAGRERSVDSAAVQRLLINLLDNAIKHSPSGASVETDLAFAPQHVCLTVADHGRGIAAEEQAKIFERFYRVGSELRRETAGVGLGLAIVKHIAEAHGGTTRVESSVGHGSRFIVELPLTEIRGERAVSADAAV